VLKPYRKGFATTCCTALFEQHPGLWHVAVIEKNLTAASFWRRFFDPYEVRRSHRDFDGEHWLVYEFES
jgi:predicted acetyltransferase